MKRLLLAILFTSICPPCSGQVQTGLYNYGAFDQKTFDTVNVGNLNVNFSVPVYSKTGRGGLGFYYMLAYNSSIWNPDNVGGTGVWTPALNWGWTANTDAHTGYINFGFFAFGTCIIGGHHVAWEANGDPTYFDTLGAAHSIPGYITSNEPTCS